jgi:hypothetical protein
MLVVDYTGGEPLDHLIREPMEIGQFLRLSVALTSAVGQLKETGIRPFHVERSGNQLQRRKDHDRNNRYLSII